MRVSEVSSSNLKEDAELSKMESTTQTILRSTALVMGLTILAKVSGLVRDVIVASQFGTSQEMDGFFVAMTTCMRR